MKNSFTVQYAVHLWIASLGIAGFPATALGFIAAYVLGSMLDRGIVSLDISIDRLKQALKNPQWRAAAEAAYRKATSKVYTEKEKDEIRKQYLAALDAYISFV